VSACFKTDIDPMSTIEQTSTAEWAEAARVFDWRFSELVRAGYSPDQAWLLANAPEVDVRLAERLLAEGCASETAQRILL
jgi:hypothetical protein